MPRGPRAEPGRPRVGGAGAGRIDVAGTSTPIGKTLDGDSFRHNAHAEPGDGDDEAALTAFGGRPLAREAVAIAVGRPIAAAGPTDSRSTRLGG